MASKTYAQHDIAAAISSGSFKTRHDYRSVLDQDHGGDRDRGHVDPARASGRCGVEGAAAPRSSGTREPLAHGPPAHDDRASEIGTTIAPPVPAFYSRPASLDNIIDHTLGRLLDLFDIEAGVVRRWRQS